MFNEIFDLSKRTNLSTMRKLTLENFKSLTGNETVIVYQNKKSIVEPKPLMLLVTYMTNFNSREYFAYGFMNTVNPLLNEKFYESPEKIKSIQLALEDGHEIYVAEQITRFQFSHSEQKAVDALPTSEIPVPHNIQFKNPKASIAEIEQYVFYLLRRHTEYLLSELALTQYPPDVLRRKTEQFINEALK